MTQGGGDFFVFFSGSGDGRYCFQRGLTSWQIQNGIKAGGDKCVSVVGSSVHMCFYKKKSYLVNDRDGNTRPKQPSVSSLSAVLITIIQRKDVVMVLVCARPSKFSKTALTFKVSR